MGEDLSRFHGLTRSQLMSRIRSRNNKKTELALRRVLQAHALSGWRRHQRLPGRPDFVFRVEKLAVFVDGCFWHGCPQHYRPPTTRRTFWRTKVEQNRTRDRRVSRELRKIGWKVLRLWECELTPGKAAQAARRIRRLLDRDEY